MRNFEKYEKEIVEANYYFGIDKSGKICKCDGTDCIDCKFSNRPPCIVERTK